MGFLITGASLNRMIVRCGFFFETIRDSSDSRSYHEEETGNVYLGSSFACTYVSNWKSIANGKLNVFFCILPRTVVIVTGEVVLRFFTDRPYTTYLGVFSSVNSAKM